MTFVNIVSLSKEFKDIVSEHVLPNSIELKNPLKFPKNLDFIQDTTQNPFEEISKKFTNFFESVKFPYQNIKKNKISEPDIQEINKFLEETENKIRQIETKKKDVEQQLKKYKNILKTLEPLHDSKVNMSELINMKFMKFRFGRMPIDSYKKKQTYLNNMPTYFVLVSQDSYYVWGFYFVYHVDYEEIDRIFFSMYFERIRIEGDTDGSPIEIVHRVSKREKELAGNSIALNAELKNILETNKKELIEKYSSIKYWYNIHDVKRYATFSSSSFYLCGWMPKKEALKFIKKTKNDHRLTVSLEEKNTTEEHLKIPTKIENLNIFKPFEQFVKMYGIPRYNEIDPTFFLSCIYIVFFGMMFGDVGHGICLLIVGLLMTFFKKGGFLSKIISLIGASSIFFGFMYGTFFGYEGDRSIIKPVWFTPMENSFNMNKILLSTIFIGIGTILVSMIINISNGIKQKNYKKIFFSQNGFAGLIFYSTSIYLVYKLINSVNIKNLFIANFLAYTSLLVILIQEPLAKICKKIKKDTKKGWFIEAFFELGESILGYITNTISFSRVGTFALCHAGIMSVIILFITEFKKYSLLIAILGNIFVVCFEALIVGIQVLRLNYYEIFSRFYSGDGIEFKPINEQL
jgi:V/A-type H+-transporting ATPase subunit I